VVLFTAIRLIEAQNNKERQVVTQTACESNCLGSFSGVSLVFLVVAWQWDRFVSVLQLSVASISLPMQHSYLLICHQHQIIQSVLIFLASKYLVIITHFCVGGTDRAEFVTLKFGGEGTKGTLVNRADRQLGDGMTGVGYADCGGGILHIAELSKCVDCMT